MKKIQVLNDYARWPRQVSASKAQLQRAEKELAERTKACAKLGIAPPTLFQILMEIVNSPKGALDSPAWTPENRREGAAFQSYNQYQRPKDLQE